MKPTTRKEILTEALHLVAFALDPMHVDALVKNAIIEAEEHLDRPKMQPNSISVKIETVRVNGELVPVEEL